MKWFEVVHHDGAIRVRIDDDGPAVLEVFKIEDSEVVVRAINRTFLEGAVKGMMFTGDVSNDQLARMHLMRANTGATWLGGVVTRLDDGELGPRFRIDWQTMPSLMD
jgi:hypothetical protein